MIRSNRRVPAESGAFPPTSARVPAAALRSRRPVAYTTGDAATDD